MGDTAEQPEAILLLFLLHITSFCFVGHATAEFNPLVVVEISIQVCSNLLYAESA